MRTAGIAIECAHCGFTTGHADASGNHRCSECGRFAERAPDYCAEHDVHLDNLPPGYDDCPYCTERRRIEQERQEMMARRANERMHPTVDAPRY